MASRYTQDRKEDIMKRTIAVKVAKIGVIAIMVAFAVAMIVQYL